jgi:hypothetical protein
MSVSPTGELADERVADQHRHADLGQRGARAGQRTAGRRGQRWIPVRGQRRVPVHGQS